MHAADLARMIKARDHPQLQRELELGALGFQKSQLGPIVEPLSKINEVFWEVHSVAAARRLIA